MGNDTSETDLLAARARQNVVLCILGILFNSVLVAVVCKSPRLRKSAKYQLVVSLSGADILVSSIYLPLDTCMAFNNGTWPFDCPLLFFAYGLQEFVVPTVTALTLAAICLEYAVTIFFTVTPLVRRRVVLTGVLLPWLLGLAAWIPVYTARVITSGGSFSESCTSANWTLAGLVALLGAFGFAPLTFLLVALVLLVVAHCCRQPDERLAVRTIIARSEGVYLTHEMFDTFIAGLISVVFSLPFLIELTSHLECDVFLVCRSTARIHHFVEVLRTAESVFFPAIWMLGAEFRHGLFTSSVCCYKYCDMDVEGPVTVR